MLISAVSSLGSSYQAGGTNPMDKMKESVDNLGSALSSGNLDDAKKAFAELQKNAPKDGKTPSEITDLQKALDSGDLKAAQQAYTKIQEKMSQGRPQGGPPPQSAQGDTVQLSSKSTSQSSSTSSNQTYDKKDANQDGTVSAEEELAYDIAHPTGDDSDTDTSSTKQNTLLEKYLANS
jgi:soluble cytochrome b562